MALRKLIGSQDNESDCESSIRREGGLAKKQLHQGRDCSDNMSWQRSSERLVGMKRHADWTATYHTWVVLGMQSTEIRSKIAGKGIWNRGRWFGS